MHMDLFSLCKNHKSHNLLILLALNSDRAYSQTLSSIFRRKNTKHDNSQEREGPKIRQENNRVMDYTETPENDDFRDCGFDCFLEEKKRLQEEGRRGHKNLALKGKSVEKTSSICALTYNTLMLSTHAITLKLVPNNCLTPSTIAL